MAATATTAERFWAKVDVCAPDDCWLWKAGTSAHGYGRFWVNGGNVQAHRFAYELTNGPIPDCLSALHSCDTPGCCNPKHLFLGTQKDNMQDAVAKGRMATGDRHGSYTHPGRAAIGGLNRRGARNGQHTHPERAARGERQGLAKLNAAKVRAIRSEYARCGVSKAALARSYGVDSSAIGQLLAGRTWRHVE